MRNPSCRVGVGFPTSSLASSALGQRSRHQTLAVDSWQMLFSTVLRLSRRSRGKAKEPPLGLRTQDPLG